MKPLKLNVNSHQYDLEVAPYLTLLDILRDELGLTGTKSNCEAGECGVCTVLVDGEAVNACLYPAMRAQGRSIVTIEGLESTDGLHPMQQAFVDYDAVQCGYCIPGMIMSAVALVEQQPDLSEADIVHALSGNICRCTGYAKIVEAVSAAALKLKKE
jgi:carbon-monoxide dehydrogenase small subunit